VSDEKRPDYSAAQLRRVLENYIVTQGHGLDRGSEGQIMSVCMRADAWRAFVATLTPIEQQVVFYHGLQGYSQDETAEIVGRAQSTVSKHAGRALKKMREWLNADKKRPEGDETSKNP